MPFPFLPAMVTDALTDLTPEILKARNIRLLMLDFDKEAAFFYLFIGYYPIIKWSFDRIRSTPLRLILKLALFSLSVVLMYLLQHLLFPMEAFMQEFKEMGTWMLLGLLVIYNISMLLYDRFLFAALLIYANRIKPRMRFLHR